MMTPKSFQWGTEEIQFMPELWRFERETGGTPPSPFSLLCFGVPILPYLSREFKHKLSFFGPLLQNDKQESYSRVSNKRHTGNKHHVRGFLGKFMVQKMNVIRNLVNRNKRHEGFFEEN